MALLLDGCIIPLSLMFYRHFFPFVREPEPSAPDTDPESDCQCQLLVSSAAPLGLQL